MIALDTNILVRFLVDEEAVEGPMSARLIEGELTRDEPGYVSVLVLAEMLWVLKSGYQVSPDQQRDIVRQLLDMPQIVIEHPDEVEQAMSLPHSDLADCILHEVGRAAGCARTVTFDRRFARLDGVQLVQ